MVRQKVVCHISDAEDIGGDEGMLLWRLAEARGREYCWCEHYVKTVVVGVLVGDGE